MVNQFSHLALASRIKDSVATVIYSKILDDRLKFMTITDVKLTSDKKHCFIYYTVLGDEKEEKGTRAALKSSLGFIKKNLAKSLPIRKLPDIEFILDEVPEHVLSIEEVISEAKSRDKQSEECMEKEEYSFKNNYVQGDENKKQLK